MYKRVHKTRIAAIVCSLLLVSLAGLAEEDTQWVSHTMQAGETIYGLSREYSVPVNNILEYNEISDPSKLQENARIVIPGVYEVERGDTLYSLSRSNGVSLSSIFEANDLEESDAITVGMLIRIPGAVVLSEKSGTGSDTESSNNETGGDADASSVVEANGPEAPVWPHGGTRSERGGRVPGVRISAEEGDPVRSVAAGRVTFVGPYAGFGEVVIVESPTGFVYVYAGHSQVEVEVGQRIERGSLLGSVGSIGQVSEVHFSVWRGDSPVDPSEAPRS